MAAKRSVYRAVDAATIRATACSWPDSGTPWPDLDDLTGIQTWVRTTWRLPGLSEAVWAASPQFAARVDRVCAGERLDVGRGRRMVVALARYLVRAQGRATPFGLFAGVGVLRFDTVASISSGESLVRVRPDAGWMALVVAGLEADPAVRARLHVQANNMATARGDRAVVLRAPHLSARVDGTVSVRNTEAVRLTLALAANPQPWKELVGKIADAFPQSTHGSAAALVTGLVGQGVLISSLRPSSTCRDPLRHVLDQLGPADGTAVSEHGSAPELGVARADLSSVHRRIHAGAGTAGLQLLAKRMGEVAAVEQPLAVDLRLADRVVLPRQVAAEVVAGLEVLRRLTPDPGGQPQWRAYRARFVDRYGTAAVVPLARLLDPVTGLGYPDHFTTASGPATTLMLSGRDERLLALAQQAVFDGVREVVLDDAAVRALAGADQVEGHRSPHVDVLAEVRAVSVAALNAGQFTVALTGMGRSAMATSGRFLDMLPDPDRQRMRAEFAGLPVAVDGALPAQLSYPPPGLHAQNVLTASPVLPWLIPLAEYHPEADDLIGLDDLGVAAGRDRLVLVSLPRRRVVEPTVAHAGALHTMPLVGRFLVEVSRGLDTRLTPFDWGAASRLPFLPALRYGRTLLASARWRIDPTGLPAAGADDGAWSTAWEQLRRKRRLPGWVQVGAGDQRLRLNLDQPMGRALLRAHLDASDRPVTLVAAASPADFGWLSGRAHEIVVPVASTAAPTAAPPAIAGQRGWPPPPPTEPVLPGTDGLICASLRVDPALMDIVLRRGLPALAGHGDEPPLLWFIRLRHPVPRLRLRLHTGDVGAAMVTIGRWAAALRRHGLAGDLSYDTHHPETGRYGTGTAMTAAYRLFAADSTAALAQLNAHAEHSIDARALSAASMIDLAGAMLGNHRDGCEWLVAHPPADDSAAIDPALRRQAVDLDPADLPAPVTDAWQHRARDAHRYAEVLAAAGGPVTPESVLGSLLHLHHVRVHGPDEATEQRTYRLARHIALATTRRRTTRTLGAPA